MAKSEPDRGNRVLLKIYPMFVRILDAITLYRIPYQSQIKLTISKIQPHILQYLLFVVRLYAVPVVADGRHDQEAHIRNSFFIVTILNNLLL